MGRMEPAIRAYLTTMREQAFIDIKPGYWIRERARMRRKPVFSAYVPPAPKKKAKVERTRYREKHAQVPAKVRAGSTRQRRAPQQPSKPQRRQCKPVEHERQQKPGKKEKIRYGQAPRATLPTATKTPETVDAGALPPEESASANEPANPLEPTASTTKTRFSARAKTMTKDKKQSKNGTNANKVTVPPPDSGEVADRSTQSTPLGLNGDTSDDTKKKKKKAPPAATTGEKTRLSQQKKEEPKQPVQMTPAAPVPGAPAPANAPKTPAAPTPQQGDQAPQPQQ